MDVAPKEHNEAPVTASSTETTSTEKAVDTPTRPASTTGEQRNFLAAFLLALGFGPMGLRHFYLGDKKLGWTRIGLFFGGYLLFVVASLAHLGALIIVSFLSITAAWVWALVDFFYVYNAVKTDAKGQPLTITPHDKKWAKILFVGTIVAFVLAVAFWIFLATLIATQMPNGFNSGDGSTGGQGYQEFIKELEKQQQSQSY